MTTHLLLVEDNPSDALFLQSMLDTRYSGHYSTAVAPSVAAAKELLAREAFDAVLLDLSLPDSQGLETINQVVAAARDLPIVVLTGMADEAIALEAVRCGAEDYLLKGRTDGVNIARAIHYAIDRKWAERTLRGQRQELAAKNKELQEAQRRLEAYRDRYIDLYDRAPLGYVTLDEEGYVQEINLAGAQLLNTDRDALTGYPLLEYVAKEDVPALLNHLRQCAGKHREIISELRLVARGGRLITAQLRSIPVEGAQEDAIFCKTAITDITERKEMEERLRQSQAFLQTVVDAIPDPMLVVDRDFRVVLANRAAREAAAGLDPASACLTCYEVFHHRKSPCEGEETCPLRLVVASRAAATVRHTHVDAHGKQRLVEISAAPVFDEAGTVTHIIEVCRDIT